MVRGLRVCKCSERLFGPAGDRVRRHIAFTRDLEDSGRRGGERGERGGDGRPVDGAVARPEMLVLHVGGVVEFLVSERAMVVVQVNLRDARAEKSNGAGDAGVGSNW